MNVMVTGATGYLGHELAMALAAAGHKVNVLVRDITSSNLPLHENIRVFRGDINHLDIIGPAVSGCEGIYHCAAIVKPYTRHPEAMYRTNVEGSRNVIHAAGQYGVRRIVFTSTCGIYGPTLQGATNEESQRADGQGIDYDRSKEMAETCMLDAGTAPETVILRLTKVFGPGPETHPLSVNKLIDDYISGRVCLYPMPSSLVSNYVFSGDAVKAHMLAMERGRAGERYIIGGTNLSYRELFSRIREVSGIKGKAIAVPKPLALVAGYLNFLREQFTDREPFFTHKEAGQIYFNKVFSVTKAASELGYQPTPFAEALSATIRFLKNS